MTRASDKQAVIDLIGRFGFIPDGQTSVVQTRQGTVDTPIYGGLGGKIVSQGGRDRFVLPGTNWRVTVGPSTTNFYQVIQGRTENFHGFHTVLGEIEAFFKETYLYQTDGTRLDIFQVLNRHIPLIEGRWPFTYHHDWYRNQPEGQGLSRGDVAAKMAKTKANNEDLYFFLIIRGAICYVAQAHGEALARAIISDTELAKLIAPYLTTTLDSWLPK